ncbi:MFS transporter [Kitasatospora mediocidica]|uniref:MFS transporter n=1 Tax=Kitasatospora mediocidica TaxID=58352 RepID=UPI00068AD479|nr:MFS transporter [Kitasatospora mediocidica]
MFAMMGFTLFTSQYLQLVKGMSPLAAALWALLPSAGVGAAVGLSGVLAGRVRPARLMAGGFLTGAAGFALMTLVAPGSPLALVLVAAGILAAGTVGTMMLTADLVVSAAPPERAGAAAATSETATELGSSLGIAVLGAAGAAVYRTRLDGSLPAGLPDGTARTAHDTLGGAVTVAAQLPARAGGELLAVTRVAFTDGMHVAAVVGVLFMVGAAFAANRLMGHLPTTARTPDAGPAANPAAPPAEARSSAEV